MAQPNVVREPSMDEILASIRRIIESNDPVPQAGAATSMAEPEGFTGRPANDDTEEVTLTVDDAFAAEDYAQRETAMATVSPMIAHPLRDQPMVENPEPLRRAVPNLHSDPAMTQPKSLSLADVAARVRAASERGQTERSGSMSEDASRLAIAEIKMREAGPVETPVPTFEPVMNAPVPPAEKAETPVPMQIDAEMSAQPVSLLSSSVGEQVARSFQDLAFAIDDAERRSLDQVAEDMLRPMLQEWLDDNLPTLVERLVREEIERVARGPRR